LGAVFDGESASWIWRKGDGLMLFVIPAQCFARGDIGSRNPRSWGFFDGGFVHGWAGCLFVAIRLDFRFLHLFLSKNEVQGRLFAFLSGRPSKILSSAFCLHVDWWQLTSRKRTDGTLYKIAYHC
jgi:hypothetical protein